MEHLAAGITRMVSLPLRDSLLGGGKVDCLHCCVGDVCVVKVVMARGAKMT